MLEDITLKEFNSLNKSEQAEALWEYGELISNRFENDYTIMLYQISSFYVEVKYNGAANSIFEELRGHYSLQRDLSSLDKCICQDAVSHMP